MSSRHRVTYAPANLTGEIGAGAVRRTGHQGGGAAVPGRHQRCTAAAFAATRANMEGANRFMLKGAVLRSLSAAYPVPA